MADQIAAPMSAREIAAKIGEVGPRAVAVQSWQNATDNGASGGGDLDELVIRARTDFP
jgi:hypothetical protein